MNRILLWVLFVVAAFALSGCFGATFDATRFAANYTGTGTLDNSKTGDLALTSDSQGIVTGTLTVTGADGTGEGYKFTAGTYALTGSLTSTGGAFEVTGTIPVQGDFRIRGRFPTDASTTAYSVIPVVANPTTYTGTLSRS